VQVTIRLFAILRERAGASEIELDLPEGARVRDALARLDDLAGGLPLVMAINRDYADAEAPLRAGDELALIPPVSGGASATGVDRALVTEAPLSLEALAARVRDPRAGAVVTFSGVTREVGRLDYEAYAEMATERIAAMVDEAIARHGLCAAAAHHRIGPVARSEPSVIVAASAPHRDAAFAGARELIDRIKAEAPIWKKEEGEWKAGSRPPAPSG
jgi:MoaE-MoaD fusion protein